MHIAKIDLMLTPTGRHLAFSKEMLEVAHVFRRVAVNAHSPYHDQDVFAPGTQLEYYVQHESQQREQEARSHIVSTTVR